MFLPAELINESLYRADVKTLGKFGMLSKEWKNRLDKNVDEICYKCFESMATYTPESKIIYDDKRLIRAQKLIKKLIRRYKTITTILRNTPRRKESTHEIFDSISRTSFQGYSLEATSIEGLEFDGNEPILLMQCLSKSKFLFKFNDGNVCGARVFSTAAIPYLSRSNYQINHLLGGSLRSFPNKSRRRFLQLEGMNLLTYWSTSNLTCVFATDNSHPLVDFKDNLFLYQKDRNRLSLWDTEKKDEIAEFDLPFIPTNNIRGVFTRDNIVISLDNKLYELSFNPEKSMKLIFIADDVIKRCAFGLVTLVQSKEKWDVVREGKVVKTITNSEFLGASTTHFAMKNTLLNQVDVYSQIDAELKLSINFNKDSVIKIYKNKLIIIETKEGHFHIEFWNIDKGKQLNYHDVNIKNLAFSKTLEDNQILLVLLSDGSKKSFCYFFDLANGRFLSKHDQEGAKFHHFRLGRLVFHFASGLSWFPWLPPIYGVATLDYNV